MFNVYNEKGVLIEKFDTLEGAQIYTSRFTVYHRISNEVAGVKVHEPAYRKPSRPLNFKGIAQFVKEARVAHGNKYLYHKSVYKGSSRRIDIICREHGVFDTVALSHIKGKGYCPGCVKSGTHKNN